MPEFEANHCVAVSSLIVRVQSPLAIICIQKILKVVLLVWIYLAFTASNTYSKRIDKLTSEVISSIVYVEVKFFAPMTKMISHEFGSGLIVSANGHFLTDFHVVKDWEAQSPADKEANPIMARIGGRWALLIEAQIIRYDEQSDIALLQFRDTTRTYLPAAVCFRSEEKPSARLVAFGFPAGHEFASQPGTFSSANGVGGI